MKSKLKRILLVMLMLGVASVVVTEIKSHIKSKKQDSDAATEAQQDIDMSLYYSYADIKPDISYLAKDDAQAESLSRLVDALNQSQPVNVSYVKSVCQTIGLEKEVYSEILGEADDEALVTKEQFDQIYSNIEGTGKIKGLDRFGVYIFETADVTAEDGSTFLEVYDGRDKYSFIVDIPEEYKDKIIDVYSKDGRVYKIIGLSDSEITLGNVWIKSIEDGMLTFLYDGVEKSYAMGSDIQADKNCVASVTFGNDGIKSVEVLDEISYVKVLKTSEEYLYLDSKKDIRIKLNDDFMIYNASGEVFCEKDKAILAGYTGISLVKNNGVPVAAIISDDLINDDIRVILSNDDYITYDMENVIFTSDSSFAVTYPDETETTYEGGAEVTVNFSDYEDGDIITAVPLDDNGITILSINRDFGHPCYEGALEINIHKEALNVINIVPMENYLYSVVSSEMPSGGNPEALKAIAVCCRAYAYTKLNDGSFEDYNANLDDSSLCQLYNSVELRDDCVQAVKETYGIVPAYKNVVITPLTYSTSYGVTSTNDEVWGGTSYEYFFSRVDNLERSKIDLSNEEDFESFIADSNGYETVDRNMPYYRWRIDFSFDEMTTAIDKMLAERTSVSSDNIKVKLGEDEYLNEDIDDIGDVLSIKVVERTKSGVVSGLLIEGSKATILVNGSSNIRNLITPVNQQIVRQDGSVITGWTSLPSPYYYVENTTTGFTVYGGGFGYGVGMSKNGAENLAEEGYNYKYIIHHYYAYVKFVSIYDNNTVEENEDAEDAVEE